jgi:predicted glycoside hydrolase/deacetylase ChbG (UPF0249 family)
MRERYLIVNADDFGRSREINRGIVRAHVEGIVTSTSLMVRWPAADEASALAAKHPRLSVGLHVDLGEWAREGGEWRSVYPPAVDAEDGRAVRAEVNAQLNEFCRLMGRDPTHIDSHQHAHRDGYARQAVRTLGRRLGIPVRHFDERVKYCGAFYGADLDGKPHLDRITTAALIEALAGLPDGTTELCTHPAEAGEHGQYGPQRAMELRALCHGSVHAAVRASGIRLINFAPPAPHPLASPPTIVARWRAAWRRLAARGRTGSAVKERSTACGLS